MYVLDFHPLLADKVRLSIMASLSVASESIDFSTLLTSLSLTNGNLAGHLRRLEEGGLIQVTKEFVQRKPKSSYACTDEGRKEMKKYLDAIAAILENK